MSAHSHREFVDGCFRCDLSRAENALDGWVVLVHPEDMNMADAKAKAAEYDATIEPNRFIARGEVILTRRSVIRFAKESNR